jgi:phenylacetate-CoA ligase
MAILNLYKSLFTLNYRLKNRGMNWDLYQRELNKQYLPKEDLHRIQKEKFRKIVSHAYRNVPFYRKLYDSANIEKSEIGDLDCIQKLPIVTKNDLKGKDLNEITAANIGRSRWMESHTSGSTNMPFLVISDRQGLDEEHAAWLRELDVMGYRLGDRILKIRNSYHRKLGLISRYLTPESHITCSDVELDIAGSFNRIERIRPDFIESFSNVALQLARYARLHGKRFRLKGFLIVGSHIEKGEREEISECFSCKVISEYGSAEGMRIASECGKHAGFHVDITRYVIEIIKNRLPAQDNEVGEVLITNLDNYAMPLIRYRIMDAAVSAGGSCMCGRTFPLVGDFRGRAIDYFHAEDGRIIWLGMFNAALNSESEYINKFQILREIDNTISVNIVPTAKMDEEKIREIGKKIDAVFKGSLKYNIKIVEKIKPAASGKAVLYRNESPANLGGFD